MNAPVKAERKITVGTINGIRKGFKNVTGKVLVARVIGILHKASVEDGANGEFVNFTGEFRAVNMTGESFISPKLQLPTVPQALLLNAYNDAKGKAVNFGYDIYVSPKSGSPLGYEYLTKPLFEAAPIDPWVFIYEKVGDAAPIGEAKAEHSEAQQDGTTDAGDSTDTVAPKPKANGKK